MGSVNLKPGLDGDIARMFGAEATRPTGERIEAKAKALADAKAKHSSVADRIDIGSHAAGMHTNVTMSVLGRDKSQIASHLEFGYFNVWAQRRLPGMHIMAEAKYA